MDETMVQDETMDDVIETDAEVIDDDCITVNPLVVAGGAFTIGAVIIALLHKKIGSAIENAEEKWVCNWCDKHGKMYISIDTPTEEDAKEN